MATLYATAAAQSKAFPRESYDFNRSVAEFEQKIRLVDLFQYVVTASEMGLVVASAREAAAKISLEDRTQATTIANGLLEVFRPQGAFIRELMEKIPSWRRTLLVGLDLYEYFKDDYDEFSRFAADLIAVHTPKEDNRQVETATLFIKSIFRLLNDLGNEPAASSETAKAQIEADLQDLLTRFAGGQGLSIKSLANVLSAIGIPFGGQPGRTPKDYSREYALKAEGLSWRTVAKHTLENDQNIREEFKGRTYDELTFEERAQLRNRVREGVRSYSKRTEKPFPPQGDVQKTH